jgi:hypothetical protein
VMMPRRLRLPVLEREECREEYKGVALRGEGALGAAARVGAGRGTRAGSGVLGRLRACVGRGLRAGRTGEGGARPEGCGGAVPGRDALVRAWACVCHGHDTSCP